MMTNRASRCPKSALNGEAQWAIATRTRQTLSRSCGANWRKRSRANGVPRKPSDEDLWQFDAVGGPKKPTGCGCKRLTARARWPATVPLPTAEKRKLNASFHRPNASSHTPKQAIASTTPETNALPRTNGGSSFVASAACKRNGDAFAAETPRAARAPAPPATSIGISAIFATLACVTISLSGVATNAMLQLTQNATAVSAPCAASTRWRGIAASCVQKPNVPETFRMHLRNMKPRQRSKPRSLNNSAVEGSAFERPHATHTLN
mmetsp:Transcript_10431/g.32341  ORF Transcript_10431/g.32341 Transcript_10431/m.32341 type:complete len:264 (+) Transcript_10431:1621-2412(+)